MLTATYWPAPIPCPLPRHSIDVVIIPHVLEFTRNPGAVLKEVERVLIAEGHLIITGFKPMELMGTVAVASALA